MLGDGRQASLAGLTDGTTAARLVAEGRLETMHPTTRFETIIRADPDLMRLLDRLRSLALPQWRLVAGCLYQTVWNVITDRPRGTGIRTTT